MEEIADRVWVLHYAWFQLNVTVVAGADGAVVVDTHASARAARTLVDDVRRVLGSLPVIGIVNTHEHFDHCFGNATVLEHAGAVPVHAHEVAAARTVEAGERVKELYRDDPDDPHSEEVLATDIRPADTTFRSRTTIDLGGRAVELSHHGRGHTGGDAVAFVPDAAVLLAGDLVEEAAPPALGEDSYPLEWPATLGRVLAAVPVGTALVPGHGTVVDLDFARAQQSELTLVADTIRRLEADGVPLDRAVAAGRWPWPEEHVHHAVRRGYAQLGAAR